MLDKQTSLLLYFWVGHVIFFWLVMLAEALNVLRWFVSCVPVISLEKNMPQAIHWSMWNMGIWSVDLNPTQRLDPSPANLWSETEIPADSPYPSAPRKEKDKYLLLGSGGCLFCSITAAIADKNNIHPSVPSPVQSWTKKCLLSKEANTSFDPVPL